MAATNSEEDDIIAKDIPEAVSILSQMEEKAKDVYLRVESLLKKNEKTNLDTSKGISFLEVKMHLLLSYVINLTYYMLKKTSGESWQNDPAIDRLTQIRTVLEKTRPIEKKLKYQIDKLIKTANTGTVGKDNDPLRFKPMPGNLVSKIEDDDESESSDDEDKQSKTGVYVPPKVISAPYDEDSGKRSQQKKEEDRLRKKALSSSLLQDLRDEYNEGPMELKESEVTGGFRRRKERDSDDHQTRYEEDNMIRLSLKKQKVGSKRLRNSLDDLTHFTDLSVLSKSTMAAEDDADDMVPYKKKREKKNPKWRKASKGKSRRRHTR